MRVCPIESCFEVGTVQKSVCVVDSDLVARESLGFLLQSNGFRVRTASAVQDVISGRAAFPADLFLLDFNTSDLMSEHIQALQFVHPRASIVLTTGYDRLPACLQAMDPGVYDVLLKPVDEQRVLKVATDATSTQRYAKFWMGRSPRTRRAVTEYRLLSEKGYYVSMQDISRRYGWSPGIATIQQTFSRLRKQLL